MERLKQRSDAVSFTVCQYEASSTVLYATMALCPWSVSRVMSRFSVQQVQIIDCTDTRKRLTNDYCQVFVKLFDELLPNVCLFVGLFI